MLTLQALMCFEGNDDLNGGTIWSCPTGCWHSLKRDRPKSKRDRVIQLNCGVVCTYASEITINTGEPRLPRSIKLYIYIYIYIYIYYIIYYILYIIYFILHSFCKRQYVKMSYIHTYIVHKTLCAWCKSLLHQQEWSSNGR